MRVPPIIAAAVQWAPGADAAANRSRIASLIGDAASHGARLIVLPEYSQHFDADLAATASAAAEALDGRFVTALHAAAEAHDAIVVAGLIEREGDALHNTVVAVAASGIVAAYRKVHLYDAFGMRESDWLAPGALDQHPIFDAWGHTIGIETCYDLRFPESTRLLVDAGADSIVVPAEWVRGPQKERHWTTLVTARAIESTAHVIAADHAPPVGAGCSTIVDPMGVPLASLGEAEGIAIASIDLERTEAVRRVNPSLANRRYRVIAAD